MTIKKVLLPKYHAGSIEMTGWMHSGKQESILDVQEVFHLEASKDGGNGGVRKELKGARVALETA